MAELAGNNTFVQFSGLSLAFADCDILKNVNLNLSNKSKAALCGINGSGKTTLLKVIAGIISADSGSRSESKNCTLSYLPQSGIVHKGSSLLAEAETAYSKIHVLIEKAESLSSELASHTEQSENTNTLLKTYHELQEKIETSGYYEREREIEIVLKGLGFSDADFEKDCANFSGGYQMRIALAKVLLQKPDILLLDEPTNYLDIEARTWLETFLHDFSGGYLLVSHDKYFLDITTNEVYEIYQGALKRYPGNYSNYEKRRGEELVEITKKYKAQQEEIERLTSLINRFRYKKNKAAFAQEQIKKLEKIEKNKIEIPAALKKININFPPPPHSPRIAYTLKEINKSYGANHVIRNLDLTIESGERLLVVGPNGAGKTTLLKIIAGIDDQFTGNAAAGEGIQIAYFSQDSAEVISGDMSILQFLESISPLALIPKVRDMAGAFLFSGDDVYKSLNVLSGGEKSRLALLQIFFRPSNVLVLDEPTNHLDLYSKDILLDALQKYKGTIIFVSHDRAFMEALSTKTLEISGGHITKLYYGNYAYYLEKTNLSIDDNNRNVRGLGNSETPVPGPQSPLPRLSREEQKKLDAEKRRKERLETALIARLTDLEMEKQMAEEQLSKPEIYSNGEKAKVVMRRIEDVEEKILAANKEWEELG